MAIFTDKVVTAQFVDPPNNMIIEVLYKEPDQDGLIPHVLEVDFTQDDFNDLLKEITLEEIQKETEKRINQEKNFLQDAIAKEIDARWAAEAEKIKAAYDKAEQYAQEVIERESQRIDAAWKEIDNNWNTLRTEYSKLESAWKSVELESSKLESAWKEVEKESVNIETAWKEIEKESARIDSSWRKIDEESKNVEKSWEEINKESKNVEKSWEEISKESSRVEQSWKEIEKESANVEKSWKEIEKESKNVEKSWEEINKESKNVEKSWEEIAKESGRIEGSWKEIEGESTRVQKAWQDIEQGYKKVDEYAEEEKSKKMDEVQSEFQKLRQELAVRFNTGTSITKLDAKDIFQQLSGNEENKDFVFNLKIAILEDPTIAKSKDKNMKLAIRKSKSVTELLAIYYAQKAA